MTPLNFDRSIDASNEEELFDQIREILQEVRPNWDSKRLEFNKYTDGITNTVLSVNSELDNEKLVFRIFGNGTENIIDRESELKNFDLLNNYELAPPIYAKFKNGFAVGHLPGETITTTSVRDPEIMTKICEKLAKLHKIPVETPKKSFLFNKAQQFLDNIPEKFSDEKKQKVYEKYFSNVDFKTVLDDLRLMISNVKQNRQVLCHNDLLINNLLYDSEQEEAHIIDYEYMAVNYQLFDIANHFNEFAGVDNVNYKLCPNDEEKRQFLKIYLTCYLEHEPTSREIEDMLLEVPIFEAASHAFWVIWAIGQANVSSIDFNYLDYAFKRYRQYLKVINNLENNKNKAQ